MKCPNCGAPLKADGRFCAYCGESLSTADQSWE